MPKRPSHLGNPGYGAWSEGDCWEEATYLMARDMLRTGCERRRVLRVLEALRRADRNDPAAIRQLAASEVAVSTGRTRPAETLARLEEALGL
jgi:hypothetical protein